MNKRLIFDSPQHAVVEFTYEPNANDRTFCALLNACVRYMREYAPGREEVVHESSDCCPFREEP